MTPTPTANAAASSFFQLLSTSDPLLMILLNIIRALVILLLAIIIARYVKGWTVRLLARSRVNLNIATLLGNIAQVAVVVLGIISALPSFGVDWTSLLTVLGVAGLAISLSMQDLLKNVIAGVYILIEQPFRIGDRISVKEVTGAVQGIELRTTILRTDDGLQVVVPNNTVLTEIITNRSASQLQRATIQVRLKHGSLSGNSSQISEALKDFSEIAASPAPVTALEGVYDGVVRLRVEFWVPVGQKVDMTQRVVEALQVRFPEANITVTP